MAINLVNHSNVGSASYLAHHFFTDTVVERKKWSSGIARWQRTSKIYLKNCAMYCSWPDTTIHYLEELHRSSRWFTCNIGSKCTVPDLAALSLVLEGPSTSQPAIQLRWCGFVSYWLVAAALCGLLALSWINFCISHSNTVESIM